MEIIFVPMVYVPTLNKFILDAANTDRHLSIQAKHVNQERNFSFVSKHTLFLI